MDFSASSWRGVMGPAGLTTAQVTFWEEVFRRVLTSDEWTHELKENYLVARYSGAAETRRRLDAEYLEIKQIMAELGMTKGK